MKYMLAAVMLALALLFAVPVQAMPKETLENDDIIVKENSISINITLFDNNVKSKTLQTSAIDRGFKFMSKNKKLAKWTYAVTSTSAISNSEANIYAINIPKNANKGMQTGEIVYLNFSDVCSKSACAETYSPDKKMLNITFTGEDTDPEFYSGGSYVNITGYTNCTTFKANATALGYGAACVSPFSGTNCTSINVTINITHAGTLHLENCEVRFNLSADTAAQINIQATGNLSLNYANISSNTTGKEYGVVQQTDGTLEITNSFMNNVGYANVANQRGIEIMSTVGKWNNNTIQGYITCNIISGNNHMINNTNFIASYASIKSDAATSSRFINITQSGYTQYYIYGLYSNSYFDNYVATGTGTNYGLVTSSTTNTVFNNIVFAGSAVASNIMIDSTSNVTFQNFSLGPCGSACTSIYIRNNIVNNNSFISGVVRSHGGLLLSINGNNKAENNWFINTVFNSSNAVNIQTGNNTNFLNVTYIGSKENVTAGKATLNRLWYVDVHANFTNATTDSIINISIWNSTGSLMDYGLTNSTGWTKRFNISQYQNISTSTLWAGNYTIYANRSGYANASISWAIGNGTSGTYTTGEGWLWGDWNGNNTRISFTLSNVTASNISLWFNTTTTPKNGNLSVNYLYVNVTANQSMSINCTLRLNATNYTMNVAPGNLSCILNLTLPEGNYTLMAWGTSATTSMNHTENLSVSIDLTPPANNEYQTQQCIAVNSGSSFWWTSGDNMGIYSQNITFSTGTSAYTYTPASSPYYYSFNATGAWSVDIQVTDFAGNIRHAGHGFTVSASCSSGGGLGGGAITVPPAEIVNITAITPAANVTQPPQIRLADFISSPIGYVLIFIAFLSLLELIDVGSRRKKKQANVKIPKAD